MAFEAASCEAGRLWSLGWPGSRAAGGVRCTFAMAAGHVPTDPETRGLGSAPDLNQILHSLPLILKVFKKERIKVNRIE